MALATLALASLGQVYAGCPFDDGSCQEYCNQQGCNLGYCGHFAWIQCICRKCGDEWNWYDKVHYNPDKQVNQTELDSLKLNGSVPLILTNNNSKQTDQKQQQQLGAKVEAAQGAQQVSPAQHVEQPPRPTASQQINAAPATKQHEQQQRVTSALTTLLIPDLSDGSKLDLNDIPDENSEKFLDYLTKNHEKLVQATHSVQQSSARSAPPSGATSVQAPDEETDGDDDSDADQQQVTTPETGSEGEPQADEAVEIQISSSNNNQPQQAQQQSTTTMTSITDGKSGSGAARSLASNDELDEQDQQQANGPVMRLLRMALAERSSDDIF